MAPGSYADALKTELGEQATVTSIASTGDTLRDLLFQPVLAAPDAQSVVILWAGTNDLNRGEDGETVFLNLIKKAQAFRDKGWQVYVLTSIQRQSRLNDREKDAQRVVFNNLIRQALRDKVPWHGVIDVAALPAFSDLDNTVTGNADIYYPDGVHLSGGGFLIAKAVRKALGF